jgi:predicted metal-dependent hydrolase
VPRAGLETAVFFETPEQICARVFRELRPGTPIPEIAIRFCPFANVNSFIRMHAGRLELRLSDLIEQAPAPVIEALMYILIAKLYRKQIPPHYPSLYRRYLNRRDVRRTLEAARQERGRKLIAPPKGEVYDLEAMFEELNFQYFHGLMSRPKIGWSLRPSRATLGHYDPSHHAIVISRILDRPNVPKVVVEYVLYHEMLHLRHPVEHRGSRRCVHTREFKEAEKQFERLAEAKALLKKL